MDGSLIEIGIYSRFMMFFWVSSLQELLNLLLGYIELAQWGYSIEKNIMFLGATMIMGRGSSMVTPSELPLFTIGFSYKTNS